MSIVSCRSHRGLNRSRPAASVVTDHLFHYIGGSEGPWKITKVDTQIGPALKPASRVRVSVGSLATPPTNSSWVLRGIASSTRYIAREESERPAPLPFSTDQSETHCAALILIRRSEEWWNLENAERTAIQQDREKLLHPRIPFFSMVAKRFLFHRDPREEFDFLAWIEYRISDESMLDEIAATIRSSREWYFVDREIDIRLVREGP